MPKKESWSLVDGLALLLLLKGWTIAQNWKISVSMPNGTYPAPGEILCKIEFGALQSRSKTQQNKVRANNGRIDLLTFAKSTEELKRKKLSPRLNQN